MKITPIALLLALTWSALALSACKDEKTVDPEEPVITIPAEEIATEEVDEVAVEGEDEVVPAQVVPVMGGREEAAEGGGKWVISNPYEVKFRVPEDWTVTIEDDGLSATDSDETTTVVLIGSQSQGTIQTAMADVQKKVKIKDVKLQDSKEAPLNGFPAQSVLGTAVLTQGEGEAQMDQEIQFIAYNVRVPKGVVTMMIFSEATMYEAKKEIIDGLAQTLTKAPAS